MFPLDRQTLRTTNSVTVCGDPVAKLAARHQANNRDRQADTLRQPRRQCPRLAPLLALLSIGGWPATFPHFRAAITIDSTVPAAVASSAVAEAAAIWDPYGIAITESRPSPGADRAGPAVDAVFLVRVAESPSDAAQGWGRPFASIRLDHERANSATIYLHYDTVVTTGLDTVMLYGIRAPQWPGALRHQVLSRIVGRVLAHEIGHWLLGSPEHASSGLMRAVHTSAALADPDRRAFCLSRLEVARLRAALVR
jgi:hypothetical protein